MKIFWKLIYVFLFSPLAIVMRLTKRFKKDNPPLESYFRKTVR